MNTAYAYAAVIFGNSLYQNHSHLHWYFSLGDPPHFRFIEKGWNFVLKGGRGGDGLLQSQQTFCKYFPRHDLPWTCPKL